MKSFIQLTILISGLAGIIYYMYLRTQKGSKRRKKCKYITPLRIDRFICSAIALTILAIYVAVEFYL